MKPSVCVMLSAYNGERYICEQIDSILAQRGVDVSVYIRDDASDDKTPEILRRYEAENENIFLIEGSNLGYSLSFWTILNEVPEGFDFYAFSDQDDVWERDKLIAAVRMMNKSEDRYKLYASALKNTDENLNELYVNTFDRLTPRFGSAVTRPRLSGCTMVFNNEVLKLAKRVDLCQERAKRMTHDSTVYTAYLACGGRLFFSKKSYINFRRHKKTLSGHGKSIFWRINSVTNVFGARKSEASDYFYVLYSSLKNEMTEENRELCEEVLDYKKSVSNTMKLFKDRRIRCRLLSVDLITAFAILCRCY